MLVVGWEQAFTEVNESIGTLQLRVLFMNLSEDVVLSDGFVFSLDLVTVPDTAGKMYCIYCTSQLLHACLMVLNSYYTMVILIQSLFVKVLLRYCY